MVDGEKGKEKGKKSKRFVCVCGFETFFWVRQLLILFVDRKPTKTTGFFHYIIRRSVCIRIQGDIIRTFVLFWSIIAIYFHQFILFTS